MSVVLDASAVLALLYEEPGADLVEAALDGAALSAANLAEILAKHVDRGVPTHGLARDLVALGVEVHEVTATDAEAQAFVRRLDLGDGGRTPTLSLGDRLCIALASRLERRVLTADRAWEAVDLPVEVDFIR